MKKSILLLHIIIAVFVSCSSLRQVNRQVDNCKILSEEEQRLFDFNFYEGLRLKEEGLYEKAFDAFMESKAVDSLDAGLLAEISFMHAAAGRQNDALKTMQQALILEPDNWWYNTQLINLYAQQKSFDKAIQVGEKLLQKYPEKEAAYHILIPLYKEQEQWKEALAMFDKLENITGINESISFEKIGLYLITDNTKKAHFEIEKLIHKFPHEVRYKILKGDMLLEQKKMSEAYQLYREIQDNDPENPYVYISLSDYYKATNQPDKSLDNIILALKNGQLEITTKIKLLGQHIEHLIRDDGKIEETEALFQLLIDHHPLEEIVYNYYASFLQYMKREDEAAKVYESMLHLNPNNAQTWFNLMQIYFSKQNYEETLQITDRAIQTIEDNLSFYFYKGITQELTNAHKDALITFMTGLSHFKENEKPQLQSDFYTHIADIYLKMDNVKAAFKAYDKAVTINPDNIHALNNYAYYLSIEKMDLQKAERMSAKTVEKEPRNSTYLDTYAWIFYQQGNYSLAKFYMERALENKDDEQETGVMLEHYGDILWMTGENDEKALETWEKAYESGYQTEELKNKIDNKGWKR